MDHVSRIPSIQFCLSVWYGTPGDGVVFTLVYLNNLVNRLPIEIVKDKSPALDTFTIRTSTHFLEPLCKAATMESPIAKFISDNYLRVEKLVANMSKLTGIKPEYRGVDLLACLDRQLREAQIHHRTQNLSAKNKN